MLISIKQEEQLKTTSKHFEYFKKRCLYWADKFGLDEWDLWFEHANGNTEHAMANASVVPQSCSATIFLNLNWDEPVISDKLLDETAKHEVVHVLLGNLVYMGYTAFKSEIEVRKAEEALVVKLCKLL